MLLLPEHIDLPERGERINPLTHLGKGLRAVWQSPTMLGLIFISGLTESCGTTVYFYIQLQLHGQGFALSVIGLVIAVSSLSQFLFTAATPRLVRSVPARWLIPLCVASQIAGLLCMIVSNPVISLLGFLLPFQAATAILYPAISTYLNQRCPETQRATVLSFETGLFSLSMIVLFPLFGLGISHVSYTTVYTWTTLALLLGSSAIYELLRLRRRALGEMDPT